MKLFYFLTLALLYPSTLLAAVAFDAKSGGGFTDGTGITVAHTTTGSDRLLLVCVGTTDTTTTHDTVTYSGVSMTQIGDEVGPTQRMSLWQLVAPATGANNIIVSLSSKVDVALTAASFTGVHQGTPLGTFTENPNWDTTVGPSSLTVTSAAGELVVDCLGFFPVDLQARPVAGTGQTIRSSWGGGTGAENPATDTHWIVMSTEAGAATVDMTYDWDATFEVWFTMGVSIKPATTRRQSGAVIFR